MPDDDTKEVEYPFFLAIAWINYLQDLIRIYYKQSKKNEDVLASKNKIYSSINSKNPSLDSYSIRFCT